MVSVVAVVVVVVVMLVVMLVVVVVVVTVAPPPVHPQTKEAHPGNLAQVLLRVVSKLEFIEVRSSKFFGYQSDFMRYLRSDILEVNWSSHTECSLTDPKVLKEVLSRLHLMSSSSSSMLRSRSTS